VLGHDEYRDAPIDRAFCFDMVSDKEDELIGLKVAVERGIPITGWGWLLSMVDIEYEIEPYPIKKIKARFNTYYFKNDTSYMIAYALYQGYKDILLWGVDQGGGPKELEHIYTMARPYVMYWLGVASGMGVKWSLAPESILLRSNYEISLQGSTP
jgi:hypothetical protein